MHIRNVVPAHELVQGDVIGVLPPLLPISAVKVTLVGVALGNGGVANAGIEPDVEDLVGILFIREALETLRDCETVC